MAPADDPVRFPSRPRPRTRSRPSSNSVSLALYAKASDEAEKNPNLRRLSLLGSFLVALSAGSNYAFSSWAPQMQESAHLSSTSLNIVGLAGNAGVYLSGPVIGRWVDKSGPKHALLFGAVLVAAGYASLSAAYSGSWSFHSTAALAFFNLLTGLGNSAAFAAAMNAQAKSWDGSKRGTATAFVLSGFGLSAFFYSTLSHSLFPGNTADYLLLLSLGSASFYILGYFIIKVLPPADSPMLRRHRTMSSTDGALEATSQSEDPEDLPGLTRSSSQNGHKYNRRRSSSDIGARAWLTQDELSSAGEEDEDEDEEDDDVYGARSNERQGLLRHGAPPTGEGANEGGLGRADGASALANGKGRMIPGIGRPFSSSNGAGAGSSNAAPAAAAAPASTGSVDITGWKLIRTTDFILLFLIMTAISGSGLLLINNCGTITRTLYDYNKRIHNGTSESLALWMEEYHADKIMTVPTFAALPTVSLRTQSSSSGNRDWPEFLHKTLGLFDSSMNTHKIVYRPSPDVLASLGRPFGRRGDNATMSAAPMLGNLTRLALDEHALVQQMQAHQVSAISLGNALGRILIGLLSDLLVNYTSPPMRVWLLALVSLLAVSSQALAAMPDVITTVSRLLIVSSLTGLMYGTLFGISPSLAFEWFGMKHFSQNWGIVSLSPVVAGNVFNILFGRVFDAHVPADAPSHQCPYGEECYRSVFVVTTVCCLVAAVLSVVLIIRRAGWPGSERR
ncbi:unnamed protein product [Tilletia controversa]|uniref:Nodulin-like domain-containing protein n=1 Tax=Tilletia controversa TaxID=13291 RepID=A0A8X7SX07_9BASI|nr:hypothetical protein CF328_g6660 [Tilletia controversa]KAE8248223.1 hypothetical protein A4X06_0g3872 [Tilletia controversa]CAD6901141.1 unnamed protein product [Tilletia controversa]CAD6927920.1 unnamed protein product [Tilletia controversa]CAD6975636.1 unnamed protein product [Tilletia controversa]